MKLKIAVLPGDGIGPEVTNVALDVVKAVCRRFGHTLDYATAIAGAGAIDAVGSSYPEETHQLCLDSQAVLFGAIGSPKYDNNPTSKVRPEQGLLAMRKKLGLYANIRPIMTFPKLFHKSPLKEEVIRNADFVCIRELTGGMYFGRPQGRSEDGTQAYDTCMYSRDEITRIVNLAYEFASRRRNKVTVVDKANILATSRLWREVAQEIAGKHPEIATDYLFVDNAAMKLIQSPRDFDVIVTENTFGDILTDEAAVISGSLGMLPSASIGTFTSVYEPIHGSYPQAAGKDVANPLAAVLSASMMFDYSFQLQEEAAMVKAAVEKVIEEGVVTMDIVQDGCRAYRTSEVGTRLVEIIERF